MADVRFVTQTLDFGPHRGGSQEGKLRFQTGRTVLRAEAALKGIYAEFPNGEHAVHLIFHRIKDVRIVDDLDREAVDVTVEYGFRDNSGDWDDEYVGKVDVLLIYTTP